MRLVADQLEQPVPHRDGRDDEAAEADAAAVAGQEVEDVGDLGRDRRVGRQEPDVLVAPRRVRVVVPGADVRVAAEPALLLAHDEAELRVRLQADDAVGDVDARVLEPLRPADVRLLVEARLQLDDAHDLLAVARRRGSAPS